MQKQLSITAIIPARAGSKSIPLKNLALINEHPLIGYSIAAARLCTAIDTCVVSTDSERIAEVARSYGAEVPFLRPIEIAQDHSTDNEFFLHYYAYLREQKQPLPDFVVHLRPTTPLRSIDVLESAIDSMRSSNEYTSLRSMHQTPITPYKLFYKKGRLAEPILRMEGVKESYNRPRLEFPQVYQPNGIVDIVRPGVLLESGTLHGEKTYIFETEPSPDIDCPHDLEDAQIQASKPIYQTLIAFMEKSHTSIR